MLWRWVFEREGVVQRRRNVLNRLLGGPLVMRCVDRVLSLAWQTFN